VNFIVRIDQSLICQILQPLKPAKRFRRNIFTLKEVPRRQPHRRSGLATLPSVGAVP